MLVYLSNTNLLKLDGLRREDDETVIPDASVTVTIKNRSGDELSGLSWPQAMQNAGGGDYYLTLPSTLVWVTNTEYVAFITATASAGVGYWEHHFRASVRSTS